MEKIKAINILGVPVHPYCMSAVLEYLNQKILNDSKSFVVTANAEILMMCQEDSNYKNILANDADLVLPDGAGTVWAGRKLGYSVPERVAGVDLFNNLLALSAENDYKVFFFGASEDVVIAAKEKAKCLYPHLKIVGYRNGFFNEEDATEIISNINASKADILFVALGAPKQEEWISKNLKQLNALITMGVGGSFDVLAGKMERAPLWMQKNSLEWLFRLYKQPKRLIRMMALPKFVIKVMCSK